MSWSYTTTRIHIFVVLAVGLTMGLTACKKPMEVGPNEAMVQANASVTVTNTQLVNLITETPTGAGFLRKPVLQIDVDIAATGEETVRWDPGFGVGSTTQARNVLLFAASSWEDGLNASNHIGRVASDDFKFLDDPITEAVDIAPGQKIHDVLYFAEPPSSTSNLILSIPPHVFGEEVKFPGYISLPYSGKQAEELPAGSLGKAFQGRGFDFTVTKASVVYQPLQRADNKPAISRDPLLRVDFTVKNTGSSAIEYMPTMLSGGVDFPALVDQKDAIQNRATFAEDIDVQGQQRNRTSIAPGKSIKDFILFDRPTRGVEQLTLYYPGKRLGGSGLVKVNFPFKWAEPEVPAEFRQKD